MSKNSSSLGRLFAPLRTLNRYGFSDIDSLFFICWQWKILLRRSLRWVHDSGWPDHIIPCPVYTVILRLGNFYLIFFFLKLKRRQGKASILFSFTLENCVNVPDCRVQVPWPPWFQLWGFWTTQVLHITSAWSNVNFCYSIGNILGRGKALQSSC